ncbi:MAG: nascent polypeptide-associated complex protein [ANME-2 cluster archaeon]|nr:nascent polypeptide-associated complex protein [ANME-2 cluster archaeon]
MAKRPAGMGGMNPRAMNQMMKQMGIKSDEIADVEQVIIRTANTDIIFDDANVTKVAAPGMTTYQIIGTPHEVPRETPIPDEDVALVAEQTGKTIDEAKAALKETGGDLAEAIMKLGS